MTEEVDFITTIAGLKKYVKEAEAAMENPTHDHFLFIIPKLLRNTGGGGGFGQHEESCAHLVGEINLTRERLEKREIKLSREQKLRNAIGDLICILTGFSTNELTTKLKFSSSEYREFISRLQRLGGFDKNTKLVSANKIVIHEFLRHFSDWRPADKIIEECYTEEMQKHLEKYHK